MNVRRITILAGSLLILSGICTVPLAQKTFNFEKITCHISTSDIKHCTGIPTLHSGVLTIAQAGTFKLVAKYDGCFMVENVIKSGLVQTAYYGEIIRFEFLTTQVTGSMNDNSDFPRTLGFAKLNSTRLDGFLTDLSALIREQGHPTYTPVVAKLQCTATK